MATITSPRGESPASITPRIKSPSVADTPTSSVRGSFEVPRNTSTPSGSAPPQRRGNRAALRDYYNLKSKGPQPGNLSRTASITSTTSEFSTAASVSTLTEHNNSATSALTAQLDNQDFDPQAYISDLLSTSSLRDILRVEATLVSEIRNLDGERKALVYDNYSKLIKAVGTIGEMQRSMNAAGGGLSEVGELDGRMDRLRKMTTSLASPEQGDTQARRDRRKCRHEVAQQKTNAELVKRVLAAPNTLQSLLDEEEDAEAEKEWEYVKAYLEAWKDVKGVTEVRTRCESIMSTSLDEEEHEGDDPKP